MFDEFVGNLRRGMGPYPFCHRHLLSPVFYMLPAVLHSYFMLHKAKSQQGHGNLIPSGFLEIGWWRECGRFRAIPLASRSDPPLVLPRLRARGAMSGLRMSDLRLLRIFRLSRVVRAGRLMQTLTALAPTDPKAEIAQLTAMLDEQTNANAALRETLKEMEQML